MSIKPGDHEYQGIDMNVSNPDVDYDEEGMPKLKPGANRRYEKFSGILQKDLKLQKDEEEKEFIEVFSNKNDLKELKYLMRKRVGAPFVTNVLRVALNL